MICSLDFFSVLWFYHLTFFRPYVSLLDFFPSYLTFFPPPSFITWLFFRPLHSSLDFFSAVFFYYLTFFPHPNFFDFFSAWLFFLLDFFSYTRPICPRPLYPRPICPRPLSPVRYVPKMPTEMKFVWTRIYQDTVFFYSRKKINIYFVLSQGEGGGLKESALCSFLKMLVSSVSPSCNRPPAL